MKILTVLSAITALAVAAPQGYKLATPTGPSLFPDSEQLAVTGQPLFRNVFPDGSGTTTEFGIDFGLGLSSDGEISSGTEAYPDDGDSADEAFSVLNGGLTDTNSVDSEGECKKGEVRHVDGTCVVPVISRKVFVFTVPQQEQETDAPLPELPLPKVEHNILFVRLPEAGEGPEPIIVPPPRQNNIVYVLNKQNEQTQRVIEVPAPPPSEPEIYFIDYEEGENPTLPGGVDLQTALGSASEAGGEVIGTTDILDSSSGDAHSVQGEAIIDGIVSTDTDNIATTVGSNDDKNDQIINNDRADVQGFLPQASLQNAQSFDSTAPSGLYSTP
ncbi:uncharacterized protein LOC122257992 [Penaeus japonicus]|uniref:uncharacterized protein LOC122257992 n=1 Tax=Penaeus japonicus TaxID=27405 RepID=UPI001C710C5E|nr:uncharacterized protein LOC122257992 [Penaeus japonicus]